MLVSKKNIPYTVTNSFFYVKDSVEPLPFLTIAPNKVNTNTDSSEKSQPIDHSDFLRQLGESIRNLKKNKARLI